MKLITPEYYSKFHCIAGACPDSCCKDWCVQVDDASATYYRALPGDLGDRLRQVLKDTEDGVEMTIENGHCPMWREDGLCRIQAALGETALCQVCRDFPRLTHDYGDFIERGLELSCPEAARLILSDTEGILLSENLSGDTEPEYDAEAMELLRSSRQTAFRLLSDPHYTVPEALTLLLMYSSHVQGALDYGDEILFDPQAALPEAAQFTQPADPAEFLQFFETLDILSPNWLKRLRTPSSRAHWPAEIRALARYGVLRYWLQAVSDYDLVSRVKLVLISCLLVQFLGGDLLQTAQQYSKEIENDADNVEKLLDAAYSHPAFTDTKLLYYFLGQN